MLTKLLDSTSFFNTEDVQVTVLGDNKVDDLVKRAAHADIERFVSTLVPEPGKAYLHINAMGAGEYYGPNKNGDYFPEEQLIKYHKTFEDTGYVYRHHINKDPAKSMGRVIFAAYNHEMRRVELIAWIDKEKGKDILERIAMGDFPMTSMACRTPFDICSICNNKASTRSQYCSHLTRELLQIKPDGKQVMALNLGPLKFFDISIVIRPADVTSSILQKVASASGEASDAATVSSAEMAEREGIDEGAVDEGNIKAAALRKLSELVKQVDGGEVTSLNPIIKEVMEQVQEIPLTESKHLLQLGSFNQVLNAFAKSGINPSSQFYMALHHNNGLRTRWDDGDFVQVHPEVTYEEVPQTMLDALGKYKNGSSILGEYVEKRAYYWEQAVPASKRAVNEPVAPAPTSGVGHLATTAAGAMVLNHLVTKDPENKAFIDRILSIFFGAALLSKLSVAELTKAHAMLNSSHGMNKQAERGLDKFATACNINDNFVLAELLAMQAMKSTEVI